MGSIARVKVFYEELSTILSENKNIPVYAATLSGNNIYEIKTVGEGIIIIGNESKGIQPVILKFAHTKITIPKKGKAESLNAAMAAGIVLSHIV